MINFDIIESHIDELSVSFANNDLFESVVIDNFCDEQKLLDLIDSIPDPVDSGVSKSRDYVFAKNKYEKSKFKEYGVLFQELYDDLVSEKFQRLLKEITGEDVFVDKDFHGGGLHQGGDGSFLDMHTDFNYHPVNKNWFRNLNILLYLNKDWHSEYGGQLKLRHSVTSKSKSIEPIFNRCVIMYTRNYTLHGYDKITFPVGQYRRSIAAYAYTVKDNDVNDIKSTVWYPENGWSGKRVLGRFWPNLVKVKNAIFGSGTKNNK